MMKASLSSSMIAALRESANGDYSVALSYEVPSENPIQLYAWQITDQGQQILNEIDGDQS